jgi:ABC-type transport system involved in multi-copper enzyme maturation permease subunit
MAVHRRGHRQYEGPLTPERWRFWILSRYAFGRVFQSRLLVIFYVLCFVPTLIAFCGVYLSAHADLLLSVFPNAQIPTEFELVPVHAPFFLTLMSIQATLSVFVTALIGPGLVSPDLTNNALPLYLSRPFSRAEYVLGKFSVLFVLLSLVTGVPMLLIYLLKSAFAGADWFIQNIHLAIAIVIGSVVWVSLLSLVSLASSALVRWRPAAAGMLFALFFIPAGFGQAANEMMRTGWGTLLNASVVIETLWNSLFYMKDPEGYDRAARLLNPARHFSDPIPAWSAWLMVLSVCLISLFLLQRKIRAHEVVR